MRVTSRTVHIEEQAIGGWAVRRPGAETIVYETAAEALAAVTGEEARVVENGAFDAAVTTIVWEAQSRVGRAVVNVLAGREKAR